MKSFFLKSILYLITSALISTIVAFADYHFGWELKRGFGAVISGILTYNVTQIAIINSKLNDILESRKTNDYHGGVGIK